MIRLHAANRRWRAGAEVIAGRAVQPALSLDAPGPSDYKPKDVVIWETGLQAT
jgi:hypothetical protein